MKKENVISGIILFVMCFAFRAKTSHAFQFVTTDAEIKSRLNNCDRESAKIVILGIAIGVLVAIVSYIIMRKRVILYCYTAEQRYQKLGARYLHKWERGYKVMIPEKMLIGANTDRFRMKINKHFAEKGEILIASKGQSPIMKLEEFVDFAL